MKTTSLAFAITLCLGLHLTFAQELDTFFKQSDAFFKEHVHNGLVDYNSISENTDALDAILTTAEKVDVVKSDTENFKAFWINAYNVLVIKGIIEQYPVKSPLDIKGFFESLKHNVAGKQLTLNDIENGILRKNFPEEARIHFALVCAGLGCPPIINEAYLPSNLESLLQRQTERALNNPDFIQIKGKKVLLSQIFEWYRQDFEQNGDSRIDFVNRFRQHKLDSKLKVGYYSYDWTLNELKK